MADWVGGESRDWWLAAAGLLLRQGQCLPARMRSAAAFHSLPAVLHQPSLPAVFTQLVVQGDAREGVGKAKAKRDNNL